MSTDTVRAATVIVSTDYGALSSARTFSLASDGSSYITNNGVTQGTASGNINGTYTTINITLREPPSSTVISKAATYQVDLVYSFQVGLGVALDPMHAYGLTFIPGSVNITSELPKGAFSSEVSREMYVDLGGNRYYCSTDGSLPVYFDSVNAAKFGYVVKVSYIITTPPSTTSDVYTYTCKTAASRLSVVDYGASNGDIVGSINQGNDIAQQGNQLQQEQNETSKNIFDKISDFFGSFFENIINAFKSLFVPEQGYFEDFFKRLNDFFSEKLGMLYAPIDFFIRFLQGIGNASVVDAGISFPGVEWNNVWIIEPQVISLKAFADDFPQLQEKIYFVTDVMMVGAVLMLLQNKLREVLRN